MPGGSNSAGFDVVLTGKGSFHVTPPPPKGEYFGSQVHRTTHFSISFKQERLSSNFE